ncbi:MAG: hypothetical protein OSJ83_02845 [Clostridia bacterium]|nr:hypothetical protein [Clostridia bacterium]
MKKKLLTVILAVVLTFGCVAGLIACGNDGEGAPDPEKIKSEKVADAEAWAKAFDFSEVDNATVKLNDGDSHGIFFIESNKIYQESTIQIEDKVNGTVETESEKAYFVKDNDGKVFAYIYNEEQDKYEKESYGHEQFNVQSLVGEYFGLCKDFSSFEFDEEKGAYVSSGEEKNDAHYEIQVKITNGKVCFMNYSYKFTLNSEIREGSEGFQIYNIGKTTVTLPDDLPQE